MKKYENLMSIELTEYDYSYVSEYICYDINQFSNSTDYKEFAKENIYSKILISFKDKSIDFFEIIDELDYDLYDNAHTSDENQNNFIIYTAYKECFDEICEILKNYEVEIYQFIIDK